MKDHLANFALAIVVNLVLLAALLLLQSIDIESTTPPPKRNAVVKSYTENESIPTIPLHDYPEQQNSRAQVPVQLEKHSVLETIPIIPDQNPLSASLLWSLPRIVVSGVSIRAPLQKSSQEWFAAGSSEELLQPESISKAKAGIPLAAETVQSPPRPHANNRPPTYPRHLKHKKVSGFVSVGFEISKQGRVTNIKILDISGPRSFSIAVQRVLTTWQFTPARHHGKVVSVYANQTFRFEWVR